MILKNGDVGHVFLRGGFYRCNLCSKHHHGEGSKDAHAAFCKQSKNYNKFYDQLQSTIPQAVGYPDLASYIDLNYGGDNKLFIPPPHKELKSNPSTPHDLDSKYNILTRSLQLKNKNSSRGKKQKILPQGTRRLEKKEC